MRILSNIDTDIEHLQREKDEILMSLRSRGFVPLNASLDDILSMAVEDILDRRLQAVTYRLGLASSHARPPAPCISRRMGTLGGNWHDLPGSAACAVSS